MNFKLITTDKKFSSFFWTQFLGAFNDNFFKNALVVIVTFKGLNLLGIESSSLVALAGALFILPFFLFSPIAGQLSDKLEKSSLVRFTKKLEIAIMFIAAIGFLFKAYGLLLFVLFLMGFQSALFGPVKYSLIPQLVEKKSLIEGNALIELGTFLAILLGTIGGGLITNMPFADYAIGVILILMAVAGYIMSRSVPHAKAGDELLKINWNPFKEYKSLWVIISEKKIIFNSVLAISWFWFFGAGILSVLPVYVKDMLNGNETIVTLFLAMFTIGVGIGSMVCEKLSFKKVEIGLVPIGSVGMTLFLLDLYFVGSPWVGSAEVVNLKTFISSAGGIRLLFDFIMMSVFGGIFIVPLYTLLQERSDSSKRSRVIAANNIFNAFMMVLSSALILVLYAYQFNPVQVLAIFAGLNAFVAIYIYLTVPEFTQRLYSWTQEHILKNKN